MISKNEFRISADRLKYFSSLLKKKYRDKENKFIIEGRKIFEEAVKSNFMPEIIFVTNNFYEKEEEFLSQLIKRRFKVKKLKKNEFSKLTDTVNSQGIAAVFEKISKTKKHFNSTQIIYLENISDPGNVGTILRNCDWFGRKEIILSKKCADIYNPKTIRASMGSIFHLNIFEGKDLSFLNELKSKNYKILSADLEGENLYKFKFPEKYILVFSSEAAGPSKELLKITDQKITIPKFGNAESLNVASASAVILSEIKHV